MNQAQSEWKLVIKLDVTALRTRFDQLQEYLKYEKVLWKDHRRKRTTNMCEYGADIRKGKYTIYRIARTVKNITQFQYK